MWDFKCLAAAACFLTSNILFIVHGVLMMYSSSDSSASSSGSYGSSSHSMYDDKNPYDTTKEHSAVKPMNYQFQYWKDLDPEYIESRWVMRAEQRPIMMSAAVSKPP